MHYRCLHLLMRIKNVSGPQKGVSRSSPALVLKQLV